MATEGLVVGDAVSMMQKAGAASSKREACLRECGVALGVRSNVLEGRAAVRARRAGWAGAGAPCHS